MSSVVKALIAKVLVTAVETTGDWIILSIATRTFEFWFVDTNLCTEPIPTLLMFSVLGVIFKASSALLASWIVFWSNLTTNTSFGNLLVDPIPTKLVVPIPIDWSDPFPPLSYLMSSPLTKKWFWIAIVLDAMLTILELLPSKYLSKIWSFLWVRLKDLLISLSVPSYVALSVWISELIKLITSFSSSWFLKAFKYTFTFTSISGSGVNVIETSEEDFCAPIVPNPDDVFKFPYSAM